MIERNSDFSDTYYDALEYLTETLGRLSSVVLWRLCLDAVTTPDFLVAPAAREKHHAYKGGLVVHTAEVLRGALAAAQPYSDQVDLDVLVTACVWHDVAKTRDYEVCEVSVEQPTGYRYTPYAKRIHHVAGSFADWMSKSAGLPDTLRDAVGHCLLAHHGRREWGSPVEPQSVEALLLHQADMLSAHYGPGKAGEA